jgi:hypothetical protein
MSAQRITIGRFHLDLPAAAAASTTRGTLTAARRSVRTYEMHGREVYADTGRPVDERLGSHVVLWIVEDPEAWARALEAEGDAELTRWPKKDRAIAETRRAARYESAAQVRADGPGRSVYAIHHSVAAAEAHAGDLRRSHPNPGVRYEIAPITEVGACPNCHQPTIHVDGQWRHHFLRYPIECTPDPEPEDETELLPGEFEIDAGTGSMTCGYCGQKETWAQATAGVLLTLTGFYCLGVSRADGSLAVLAEGKTPSGKIIWLPHPCTAIPQERQDQHASEIARFRAATAANGASAT